jgi:DNA invertase Pin-like site-specific DNA recombinase
MIYGYARVSLAARARAVAAQARQLAKAGCKKVFREVHVSGAKTDRARVRRVIEALQPGDVLMVMRLDWLGRSTRDLLKHPCRHHRAQGRFPIPGRCMGRHHHVTRTARADRARGLAEFERDLIRARTGEGRERAKARGVKTGRKPKLTTHQRRKAIKRRENGERVREIARRYNVNASTIRGWPRSAGRAASRDSVHRWKRGRSRSAWIIDPILPARAEHGGLGRRRPPRQDRR